MESFAFSDLTTGNTELSGATVHLNNAATALTGAIGE